MNVRSRLGTLLLVLTTLLTACANPQTPAAPSVQAPAPAENRPPAAPKRVTLAISGYAPALHNKLNLNNSIQGVDHLEQLANAGTTSVDRNGVRRPQLAVSIPSVDDGTWKVNPDGTMETTWKIKPGAMWHDGTPFTAEDLAFTVQVGQDRDLVQLGSASYASVDAVEVIDPQTAVVKWRRPFIDADTLFSVTVAEPLPKHVLERAYQEDKAHFLDLPFWTVEYVGAGPFKLREFARDDHVTLEAFDGYVLGRPKLDVVEVKFIPDGNTLGANILAGAVELTIGRGLSLEQGVQIRDQWREGRMDSVQSNGIFLWPQLLAPSPAITGDVRFRKALLHATDLKEITNELTLGLGTPLESIIKPTDPEYRDVDTSIVRYPYDASRAAEMIGALGYTRGSDGMFRNAAGETIAVEMRTLAADLNQKTTLSVIDYWRRAGVDASLLTIPPQRQGDAEWRATFPGWQILLGNPAPNSLHSSRAQLPQNNFQSLGGSGNYPRYMDPAYDALSDRYYATIPRPERMELLRQLIGQQTDQVLVVPLFQYVQPAMVSNRLKNVTGGDSWNAHEWDVNR